jgi:hypothetical protein
VTQFNLEAEFQDILANHPSLSYLELLSIARERGWGLDKLTSKQEAYAAKTPAKTVLMIAKVYGEYSARKTSDLEQIIPTGTACHFANAIESQNIRLLRAIFIRQVADQGSAPMELTQIFDHEKLVVEELLISLSRSVLRGIAKNEKLIDPAQEEGEFAILMNRCLLRRTYSTLDKGTTIKNRNNQHWHQDSSVSFQNRPMLTIWAPLQKGAGKSIPGIEIAELSINHFVPRLGDGVEHLEEVCKESASGNQNTQVATVEPGGCIVFNGLTFHRTYTTSEMVGYRDALLVRICPKMHAPFFPGNRSNDLFFKI